jgi:hypothetical protein
MNFKYKIQKRKAIKPNKANAFNIVFLSTFVQLLK